MDEQTGHYFLYKMTISTSKPKRFLLSKQSRMAIGVRHFKSYRSQLKADPFFHSAFEAAIKQHFGNTCPKSYVPQLKEYVLNYLVRRRRSMLFYDMKFARIIGGKMRY